MAKAKVAINGFGRIGRLFFRQAFEKVEGFDVVVINDLGDVENFAYLLKYDSVYGRYDKAVSFDKAQNAIIVDGKPIKLLQEKDPAKLPWKELGIDIAVESTGFFDSYEGANAHFVARATRAGRAAP